MWPFTLSGRLPIAALVSHYLTNKLIGRGPIQRRQVPKEPRLSPRRLPSSRTDAVLPPVSRGYPPPLGRLPTRYSPVRRSCTPEGALPLDLHVLGTPPAFILSQDQTLQLKISIATPRRDVHLNLRVLVVRTRSCSVVNPKIIRQRSAGLSRSSFQRASSRSGLINVGHTEQSVKHLSVKNRGPCARPPNELGAQRYGNRCRLSTPAREFLRVDRHPVRRPPRAGRFSVAA